MYFAITLSDPTLSLSSSLLLALMTYLVTLLFSSKPPLHLSLNLFTMPLFVQIEFETVILVGWAVYKKMARMTGELRCSTERGMV